MVILLWRVLDNHVVEACLGPALALCGLTVAVVLLPAGSSLEGVAAFNALVAAVVLVWRFISQVFRGDR